jgi:proliferating cell nuclear antigen
MPYMSLDPLLARQFIDIMGALVDEFRLHISKDGWKVAMVDPANVAMVLLDLPKDNFQSYEFPEDIWTSSIDGHPTGVPEEIIVVGIDVSKIDEFLPGKDEIAGLQLPEELEPVEFTFINVPGKGYQLELKHGIFSRTIELLPENSIRRSPKIPALGLDYRLLLKTQEFRRIVKKAAKIADYIVLSFMRQPDQLMFTATVEEENRQWAAKQQIRMWNALKENARYNSSSMFSLDYLEDIAPVIPSDKCPSLWLHLGHDHPCKLEFVLGQTGTVEYLQAPRVEYG